MKKKMILLPLCAISLASVLMKNDVAEASTEYYGPYKYFDSTYGYYGPNDYIYGTITYGPPIVTMEQGDTVVYSNQSTQEHNGYTFQSGSILDKDGKRLKLFTTYGPDYKTMEQGSKVENSNSNEMYFEEPMDVKKKTPREERIAKRDLVKAAEEIIEQYRLTSNAFTRVEAIEKVKLLDEAQQKRLNPKIERVYWGDYKKY